MTWVHWVGRASWAISHASLDTSLPLSRCWRSLNTQAAAVLVHALMTSRMDYCNTMLMLTAAPKSVTVTCCLECSSTDRQWHAEVWSWAIWLAAHWELASMLDVPSGESSSNSVSLFIGLQCKAQQYLIDHCTSISEIACFLVGNIHNQPVITNWSCHATDAPHLAAGLVACWPNSLERAAGHLRDSGRSSQSFKCSLKTSLLSFH